MRGARGALAAIVVLAALGAPGAAAAEDASAARVRVLAARAADDPAALAALRRIDRIDGRPAPLAAALGRASGPALAARLRALAGGLDGRAREAGDPPALAREILAERRFQPTPAPRPFRGLLRLIARSLDPLLGALGGAAGAVGRAWPIVAIAVAALAAAILWRTLRRPSRAGLARAAGAGAGRAEDPDALERGADRAERDGDLEAAVRLRFRAGLRRLELSRAIPLRPPLLTSEVSRRLASPSFDRLAATFDEVAYGARPARPSDVAAARTGWAHVLAEVAGR